MNEKGNYGLGKGSLSVERSVRDMSPSRGRYHGHPGNDGGVTMGISWLGTMGPVPHYAADPPGCALLSLVSEERYAPTSAVAAKERVSDDLSAGNPAAAPLKQQKHKRKSTRH